MADNKVFQIVLYVLIIETIWGLVFKGWFMVFVFLFLIVPSVIVVVKSSKIKQIKTESHWIFLFIFTIFLNVFCSRIFRGQAVLQSLANTELLWFFFILSFFFFFRKNPSSKQLENSIDYLFLIFCVCYLLQYFIFYPKEVFTMLANTEYEHRFRMVGQIIVFVGFFMYLNRVVINKFSFLDYLKLLLSLFIIVLLGFRSSFAAILIASTIMIVRINGINVNIVKFFLLAVIGFSIIISTDSGEKMMRRMIDRNEESNFSNSDYIRVRQWNYFTNYHFQSNAERFFGTGIPAPGTTYYKQMMELADNYKKNLDTYVSVGQWRDWGLIGLSWVMGIPAVAVLILFIGYMIFSKTDTSHYYISSTYICLFLSSLTTIEFYRHGAFVFHGILLYLIYKLKKEKKLKLKYENWNNNTTIGK